MINHRRRQLMAALTCVVLPPALATPEALAAAISAFTGGAPHRAGKVRFEIAQLIDNGNAVPVTVSVDSPMTAAEHVTAIGLFNERNPSSDIAVFALGPRSGKAQVSTRIRLATSQRLVALARLSDGSYWSQAVDVIVTLAACIEGEGP
ncbi:MAG: SoxY-related AACIE arm protein [Sphingomonadaceae bacterium]